MCTQRGLNLCLKSRVGPLTKGYLLRERPTAVSAVPWLGVDIVSWDPFRRGCGKIYYVVINRGQRSYGHLKTWIKPIIWSESSASSTHPSRFKYLSHSELVNDGVQLG
jgi:hypothetical protein